MVSLVCSVHYFSNACAALHDSSVKTRAKLKVHVDYAHTHGHRVADILVNLSFNLGIYLSPFLGYTIMNSHTQRRCSVGRMKEHFFVAVVTILVEEKRRSAVEQSNSKSLSLAQSIQRPTGTGWGSLSKHLPACQSSMLQGCIPDRIAALLH